MTEEIDLARQLTAAQKETKLAKLQLQKSNTKAQHLQQQLDQIQLELTNIQQSATNENPEVQQSKIFDLEIELKALNEVLKQKNQNISNLQQQLAAKDEIINEMSNMNGQQPYNELLKSQIVQQQSQIKSLINTVKQVQPFTDEERQQLIDEIFQLKQELEKKEQQMQTKLFQEENDIQIMDFLDDTSDNKKIPPNTPADDGQHILQIQEQSFLQRQLNQQIFYNQELSQQIQVLKNQLDVEKSKQVERHRQDHYATQHKLIFDSQTPDMPSDQINIGALAPDVNVPEQPMDNQIVYQQAPDDDAPELPRYNISDIPTIDETTQNISEQNHKLLRHETPVTIEYSNQKAASVQISPLKSSAVLSEQVMDQNKDVPQKLQQQIERLEQEISDLVEQLGNNVTIPRKPQMKPPTTDVNQLDQQIIKRQQEYLVSLLTYKNELNDCKNQSKDNNELIIQTLRFQLAQRDDNQQVQEIIQENMMLKQQLRKRGTDEINKILQDNAQLKQQLIDVQHLVNDLQDSQSRIQFDNEKGQLSIDQDMRLSKSRFENDVKKIDSDNIINQDTILLQSKVDLQQNIIVALEQDIQELIERDISTRQENILIKSQLQQSTINTSCDQQVFDLTMKEIQLQKQQLLTKLQEELNQRATNFSNLAVQHEQLYQYQSEIQQLKQTIQVQAAEIQLLYSQDNKQQVVQLQQQLQQVMELSQTREEVFQNQQLESIPVQTFIELSAKFRAIEAECALLRKVNEQLAHQNGKSPVESAVIDVPMDYVDKKTRRMMEINHIDVPVQSIEYIDKKTRKLTRIVPNPGYDQV